MCGLPSLKRKVFLGFVDLFSGRGLLREHRSPSRRRRARRQEECPDEFHESSIWRHGEPGI
jgi:hypothetical protein